MKRLLILALLFLPAACGRFGVSDADLAPPPGMTRPMPRPDGTSAPVPISGAVTAEQYDTTTAEQRAAAKATATAAREVKLGRTVATLGDPADPGFWVETPLAERTRPGRIVAVATGQSVAVELRPIDGPASAGSRISLPALRLIGLGLAGLHEIDIFASR